MTLPDGWVLAEWRNFIIWQVAAGITLGFTLRILRGIFR